MIESAHAEGLARLSFKSTPLIALAQQKGGCFALLFMQQATHATHQKGNTCGGRNALKISGILNPIQFPPPGIKRDLRGIHSLFTSR
jgi:hypothetical protein